MQLVEDEVASVTALDAGEVFTGGRYYSLVPILQQLYTGMYVSLKLIGRSSFTNFNRGGTTLLKIQPLLLLLFNCLESKVTICSYLYAMKKENRR